MNKSEANNRDKWCAEQCGVEVLFTSYDGGLFWYDKLSGSNVLWTIQDPRCREIVRERFEIATHRIKIGSHVFWWSDSYCISGFDQTKPKYKTIAEAEIACITAIWEARDE